MWHSSLQGINKKENECRSVKSGRTREGQKNGLRRRKFEQRKEKEKGKN